MYSFAAQCHLSSDIKVNFNHALHCIALHCIVIKNGISCIVCTALSVMMTKKD
jgi:hypothetical protein